MVEPIRPVGRDDAIPPVSPVVRRRRDRDEPDEERERDSRERPEPPRRRPDDGEHLIDVEA
jgi:hypothetical protein